MKYYLIKKAIEAYEKMNPTEQKIALQFIENQLLGKTKENEKIRKAINQI